jgi:hypothetical protein
MQDFLKKGMSETNSATLLVQLKMNYMVLIKIMSLKFFETRVTPLIFCMNIVENNVPNQK